MQAQMKVLLAGYWYKKIWKSLGRLHEIDANGDGVISKDEVKEALQKKFGSRKVIQWDDLQLVSLSTLAIRFGG